MQKSLFSFQTMGKRCALIVLGLMAVLASGCATHGPSPLYPEKRFDSLPKIALNVGKVEFVEEYVSPRKYPNVEYLFPVTLTQSMRTWTKDRIQPTGGDRTLKVVVRYAGVIEEPVSHKDVVKSPFAMRDYFKYDANYHVRFEVYAPGQFFPEAEMSIKVNRYRHQPRDASAAEREFLFYELGKDLITDFNAEVERNITNYFHRYQVAIQR